MSGALATPTRAWREMWFHRWMWIDPAANYHHYAVLWNTDEITFLVDDVPVRH